VDLKAGSILEIETADEEVVGQGGLTGRPPPSGVSRCEAHSNPHTFSRAGFSAHND